MIKIERPLVSFVDAAGGQLSGTLSENMVEVPEERQERLAVALALDTGRLHCTRLVM